MVIYPGSYSWAIHIAPEHTTGSVWAVSLIDITSSIVFRITRFYWD